MHEAMLKSAPTYSHSQGLSLGNSPLEFTAAGHLQNKRPSSKLITNDILYNYKQPQTLKVEVFGHFQTGFKS